MNLSSEKNKILVFSDPHQEINRVEYILRKENYDIAVCLGDWFDSFTYNSEYDVESTCRFLKKWVPKDNFFTCIGNHDIQYLHSNNTTICSGYDQNKDLFITNCFGNFLPFIRDKFKWYIWIDEFLCSHAGVNTYHFDPLMELTKDGVTKWLDKQIQYSELSLINGGRHWLYGAGQSRGGSQKVGGITWQDFDCEFIPIKGIKQLVGHTPHNIILNHKEDGNLDFTACENLDIDCHLNQYLLIQNKKIKICNYKDL